MRGRRLRRIGVEEIQFGGRLSRWIQKRRAAFDLTQVQLADALGVSAAMVHRWESASSIPNAYHYRKLMDVLAVRAKR